MVLQVVGYFFRGVPPLVMLCDGLRLIDEGVGLVFDWRVQTGVPCFVSFDWEGTMTGSVEAF